MELVSEMENNTFQKASKWWGFIGTNRNTAITGDGGTLKNGTGGCGRCGGCGVHRLPPYRRDRTFSVLRKQLYSWILSGKAWYDFGHSGRLHHAQCERQM